MNIQALSIEFIISGFFAVACFRARAKSPDIAAVAPRALFGLTNRLERLRRSRWQWFSIVLLLVVVRMQLGMPMLAELTALVLFLLFLALPTLRIPAREGSHCS